MVWSSYLRFSRLACEPCFRVLETKFPHLDGPLAPGALLGTQRRIGLQVSLILRRDRIVRRPIGGDVRGAGIDGRAAACAGEQRRDARRGEEDGQRSPDRIVVRAATITLARARRAADPSAG